MILCHPVWCFFLRILDCFLHGFNRAHTVMHFCFGTPPVLFLNRKRPAPYIFIGKSFSDLKTYPKCQKLGNSFFFAMVWLRTRYYYCPFYVGSTTPKGSHNNNMVASQTAIIKIVGEVECFLYHILNCFLLRVFNKQQNITFL